MLAQGLLCRLAADAPKTKTSIHNLPQLARMLQRSILSRNGLAPPTVNSLARAYRNDLVQYRRSYVTTATAKKPVARKPAATKPTATVKKAVKKVAATKKTPATKKTAPAAKKTAKKSTAKKTTKKPAAKKKAVAKPKKVKKELTPEKKLNNKVRELKKMTLRPPPVHPLSAWLVFVGEAISGSKSGTQLEVIKTSGPKFQALTSAEKEHYNHLANEQNIVRKEVHKAWIEAHTAEEIRVANKARLYLRRLHKASGKTSVPPNTRRIPDERTKPKPPTMYAKFTSERYASGDFKSISLSQAAKLISTEWKALSESEKQAYQNPYAKETAARA